MLCKLLTIATFRGRYRFLSNFFIEPDGTHVEGEYQAAKCLIADDAVKISMLSPAEAKRQGQLVLCRKDWDEVKTGVMTELVRKKFLDHLALAKRLLETGDVPLVEGNDWHDTFWGRCRCRHHGGDGWNNLGNILMQVRRELQK